MYDYQKEQLKELQTQADLEDLTKKFTKAAKQGQAMDPVEITAALGVIGKLLIKAQGDIKGKSDRPRSQR